MVELKGRLKNTTLDVIESWSELEERRSYLGMSQIGHQCRRYLFYSFRWCYDNEFSARMVRLFDRGDREEEVILKLLHRADVITYGYQEELTGVHGHFLGHVDGKAINIIEAPKTEHLLEFKTHNDKSFKAVKKEGVKVSKPEHFAQMQIYMKYTKLTRALYVAVNKNDDSLYIERVYEDKDIQKALIEKAESIILNDALPNKEYKPTWYQCKFCSARFICHEGEKISITCRSCHNCDIENNGKWSCSKYEIPLTTAQQKIGCSKYELMESLR